MIRNIIAAFVILIIGYNFGRRSRSKELNDKILYMRALANDIKAKNNKMVDNFAHVYSMTDHDPSKFTEVDDMLYSMWIDD